MKHTVQQGAAGNYDAVCERLSLDLKAAGTVLIVIGGRHGSGMSVTLDPKGGVTENPMGSDELARMLREVADKLDDGEGPCGTRITATDEVAS